MKTYDWTILKDMCVEVRERKVEFNGGKIDEKLDEKEDREDSQGLYNSLLLRKRVKRETRGRDGERKKRRKRGKKRMEGSCYKQTEEGREWGEGFGLIPKIPWIRHQYLET